MKKLKIAKKFKTISLQKKGIKLPNFEKWFNNYTKTSSSGTSLYYREEYELGWYACLEQVAKLNGIENYTKHVVRYKAPKEVV